MSLRTLPERKAGENLVNFLFRGSADRLMPQQTDGYKLDGSDTPWQRWLSQTFPREAAKPLAPRHIRFWEWFDALKPGERPRPIVEPWPRGGGKSTTAEIATVRVCVKLSRRYVLYVCGTQEQADKHTQAVAKLLEDISVDRSVNRYGHSRGWRRDQLRTANGFNVTGIGLKDAVRGIKVDHFRPDLIILDDIDDLDDTPEAVADKIEKLAANILFASSDDCAIAFTQNVIHSGSIMNSIIKGQGKILRNAQVSAPEVAIEGLETEEIEQGINASGITLPSLIRITGGRPTWEGQSLDICEKQINETSLEFFKREMQHDLRYSGVFFPQYDPNEHLVPAIFTPDKPPPHWYTFFGGLDWGFAVPYAWSLCFLDENGMIHVPEGYEKSLLRNEEQAAKIVEALDRWSIPKEKCVFTYDPTMDNERTYNGAKTEPDIQAYIKAGLKVRPADKRADSTQHGWNKVRDILARPRGIVFYRGYAGRLAEAVQDAKPDKLRPEELRHDGNSHLCHSLMYSVTGQLGLAVPPISQEEKATRAKGKLLRLVGFDDRDQMVKGRNYV